MWKAREIRCCRRKEDAILATDLVHARWSTRVRAFLSCTNLAMVVRGGGCVIC